MAPSIRLLLNDREVELDVAAGMATLDVVRDQLGLKGTKHACREGDCGACTVLLGELSPSGCLSYRAVISCLLPLGEAEGRHVVTVEGLNGDGPDPGAAGHRQRGRQPVRLLHPGHRGQPDRASC